MKAFDENLVDIVSNDLKIGLIKQSVINGNNVSIYIKCRFIDYCTDIFKKKYYYMLDRYSKELPELKSNDPSSNPNYAYSHIIASIAQSVATLMDIHSGGRIIKPRNIPQQNLGIMGAWVYFVEDPHNYLNDKTREQVAVLNDRGVKVLENLIDYIKN